VISRRCFQIRLREGPEGPAAEGAGVDVPLSDNRELLRVGCMFRFGSEMCRKLFLRVTQPMT